MGRFTFRWLGLASILSLSIGLSLDASTVVSTASSSGVAPNSTSEMDCNGHSPLYKSVKANFGNLCTDPISIWADGKAYRFYDNGHYVGHDEPSVKFISSAPGSANEMTYVMTLSTDPKAKPTLTGNRVSDYAELSSAPWFGLPICDPRSYPQNSCKPDSDSNASQINNPGAAGSAFMELQFYPPGYMPFVDGPSCDATRWCSALTIDSLMCTFGFATCNGNCIEPVNFAYIQRDGVPAGPPSPQLTDISSFTPNGETLMMNPGDRLKVSIADSPRGLRTTVSDLTTGQSGFMVASSRNGFMNTNMADCSGTPFNFHAEYNRALQQNQVPWAALEGGVLMENETGHFEPCKSLANPQGFSTQYSDGKTFSDPSLFQTCVGGSEGKNATGEGPCSLHTGDCVGSTTEGGAACPSTNFTAGQLCEYSDWFCMPAGTRTIFNNGVPENVSWPIAGCQANALQNGDLDFDGSAYVADWPDGTKNHPTPLSYTGPIDGNGNPYPKIQFETDLAGSEFLCNTSTGAGCTAPPVGPNGPTFYPFWTLGSSGTSDASSSAGCVWNIGNVIAGSTVNSFGGVAEYGTPDVARYAGTLTSPVIANPQLSTNCNSESH